ncbi:MULTISPECIES: nuclear transport factor 2 family protein [Actinoplanes]|uniref:nuclear transport factor 2 family protein n=1 Tax=Actinoplanes TaxID=1865 RepID=UPI0005F2D9DE|nr:MULTISPECIES: nuclear transport factor 2 family protein [Actinoplanes]GLY02047.1 isomerase [Actinoplanes sp. NBRC 101535]
MDFTEIIERYLAVWNEDDAVARRTAIDEVCAENVRYVDPMAAVDGRAALDALVEGVRKQFGGLVFSLGGPVDAHHDQARFTWHLGAPGEEPLVIGFDVVVRDTQDRIITVYGFLDRVPGH